MFGDVTVSFPLSLLSLLSPECLGNIGAQPSRSLPENSPTLAKELKSERKELVTSQTLLAYRNQWKNDDPGEAPSSVSSLQTKACGLQAGRQAVPKIIARHRLS